LSLGRVRPDEVHSWAASASESKRRRSESEDRGYVRVLLVKAELITFMAVLKKIHKMCQKAFIYSFLVYSDATSDVTIGVNPARVAGVTTS